MNHKTNSFVLHQGIVGIEVGRYHVVDPAWQANRKGRRIFSLLFAVYYEF